MDLTITLGNILQITATIVAVFMAYVGLRERLVGIETRLNPLWDEYTDRRKAERRREDRE